MLIELRVQNHRSLLNEQVLTMEAATIGDRADPRPRHVAGHDPPLLPTAALYGANASGKSNLLAAFAFMREAVVHSQRSWSPDAGVPREPFAWAPDPKAPSVFEVAVLVGGVRYDYGFAADDGRFLEEWLYAWPRRRKQVWLERDCQSFKFGEHLKGELRVIEQVTRPNALFLAAAAQNNHEQLGVVHRWFERAHLHGVRYSMPFGHKRPEWYMALLMRALYLPEQLDLFGGEDWYADESKRALFKDLLRAADTGITDVRVTKEGDGTRRAPIELRHQGTDSEAGWLPLHQESQGTIAVFALAPYVIDALHRGSVIFADELESSLHPLLARRLVELFHDPETNPHNAQLVFATHNTSLLGRTLGEPLLRRDQIWLCEKGAKGESCIYPLTEYKPRKAENLERGYLLGRYGGIPLLGDLVQPSADAGDGED